MSEIYQRIRQRRLELGLSQDELAKKLGYKSRSSINKIESGENDIPQSKISAFAKALNTTSSFLMGWDDNPEDQLAIITDSELKKEIENLLEITRDFSDEEFDKLLDHARLLAAAKENNQKDQK